MVLSHASHVDVTAMSLPADRWEGETMVVGNDPPQTSSQSPHGQEMSLGTVAQHLIDERHMWISKCITQGFNVLEGDFSSQIERLVSSGTPLERINRFLAPYGPRGLFCLLGAGMRVRLAVRSVVCPWH